MTKFENICFDPGCPNKKDLVKKEFEYEELNNKYNEEINKRNLFQLMLKNDKNNDEVGKLIDENYQLKGQVQDLMGKFSYLNNKISNYEEMIKSLEEELKQKKDDKIKVVEEYKDLDTKRAEKNKEVKVLQMEIINLDKKKKNIINFMDKAQETIRNMNLQYSLLLDKVIEAKVVAKKVNKIKPKSPKFKFNLFKKKTIEDKKHDDIIEGTLKEMENMKLQ